jgi:hypothetical protein
VRLPAGRRRRERMISSGSVPIAGRGTAMRLIRPDAANAGQGGAVIAEPVLKETSRRMSSTRRSAEIIRKNPRGPVGGTPGGVRSGVFGGAAGKKVGSGD